MGKTIRANNPRVNKSNGCNHATMQDQLIKVKQTMLQTPENFVKTFKFSELVIDSVFPNQFGDTIESYLSRSIKNYEVVINDLNKMIKNLLDPNSDRPLVNEFNWILLALDHTIEIEDTLFLSMTHEQKYFILQKMIEESEIRLTMFNSIPVSFSLVSQPNPESEIMNNTTTTSAASTNDDTISDVIEKAVEAGEEASTRAAPEIITEGIKKAVEEAAKAGFDVKTDPEIQRLLKTIADATKIMKEAEDSVKKTKTEETTEKATEEVAKPEASKMSKYAKIAAYAVGAGAIISAGVYLYRKSSTSIVSDLASEQVVGG